MDDIILTRLNVTEEQLAAFCGKWKIERLELFGSVRREDFAQESDIDLLVIIGSLTGGRFERYRPVRELVQEVSEELADRVSLIVSTPEGAEHVKPYYLGMLSGHVMLHDAGGFFAAVLEGLQRRLRELGARRYVDDDGYEYWDLKPDWKPGDVVSL